ncbi:hypothetical protein DUNSADRAFT_8708 [Dunaliella salina]|uniref:Protein kinase domain-containing protein n=1 Tax=Dunaliella salina TaxID=3046 RepID=A0ABQ7GIZ5_DUNSA|nr:hypothetical protein DUNSADRAFT_8708 [Dunaliella salina]|eukprot:KAF5834583.1 hypothetical protein DUNSADRAFT_8708 [Dunaliella salina]
MGNCVSSGEARRKQVDEQQEKQQGRGKVVQAGEHAESCQPNGISCGKNPKPTVQVNACNGGPPWQNGCGGGSNAASSVSEQGVLPSDAAHRTSLAERAGPQQGKSATSQRAESGEYWEVCHKQAPAGGVPSKTSSFRTQTSSSASAPISIRVGSSEEQPADASPGTLTIARANCPPLPPNNDQRIATIEAMSFMEATPCAELGLLLDVICKCWDAHAACITLLGAQDVWMSNCVINGSPTDDKMVPWEIAMCPWTLLPPHPTAMAINDLANDARFAGNKHHKGGTKSYLTSPLVASNGHRVGAICIMDQKPRMFAAADCRLMNNFSELAVRELERHSRLVERLKHDSTEGISTKYSVPLAQAFSRYVRNVEDAADSCVMLVDTRIEGWKVLYCGVAWKDWTGCCAPGCLAHKGMVRIRASALPTSMAAAKPIRYSFYLSMRPAALDPLDANTLPIGIPSSVPIEGNEHLERAFYFVRAHAVPDPPNNSGVTNLARSTRMSIDHHHRVPRRRPELSLGPLVAAQQLFPSLVPRQILGRGQGAEMQFLPLCHAALEEARSSNQAASLRSSVPKPLLSPPSFRHYYGLTACSDYVPSGCQCVVDGGSTPDSGSFVFPRQPGTNLDSNQQLSSTGADALLNHQSNVQEHQASFTANLGRQHMETLDEEPAFFPSDHLSDFNQARKNRDQLNGQSKQQMQETIGVWADHVQSWEDLRTERALSDPLKPHTIESQEHWQQAGLEMQAHSSNPLMGAAGKGLLHIGGHQLPKYRGPMWHPMDTSSMYLAKFSPEEAPSSQPISKDAKESVPERATAAFAATEPPNLDAVLSSSSSANATTGRALAGTISAPLPTIKPANSMQEANKVEQEEEGCKHSSGYSNARHCVRCISLKRGIGGDPSHLPSCPTEGPSSGQEHSVRGRAYTSTAGSAGPLAHAHSNSPAGPAKPGAPRGLLRQRSAAAAVGGQRGRRKSEVASQRRVSFRNLPPSPTFVSMPAAGLAKPSDRSETGNEALFPYFRSQSRERHAILPVGSPASGSNSKLPLPSIATNNNPSPRSHSPASSSGDAYLLSLGRQASRMGTQGDGAESNAGSTRRGRSLSPFSVQHIDSPDLQQGARASRGRVRLPYTRSGDITYLSRDAPRGLPPRTLSGFTEASYATRSSSRGTLNTNRSSRSTPASKAVLACRTSGEAIEQCGRLQAAATEGCAAPGSPDGRASLGKPSEYPFRLRQWLLLEFCDKGNLANAIDQGWLRTEPLASAPLSLPVVLACAQDVARGLAYLHQHCVVHGNLTAENVLLQSAGVKPPDSKSIGLGGMHGASRVHRGFVAKISDFTKSRTLPLEGAQQCISTGSYHTIDHVAPEVIRDQRVSYKGDIYSLGIILWRMLTSSRPWFGLSHQQIVEAVCEQGQRLGFPRHMQDMLGLQDLALRCMAHEPDERPSAADVLAELEAKAEMS